MVSKEHRGFFYSLSPLFPFFFLAVAWFLAVKLKQKFSARQSVGNCTGGNWRAAFLIFFFSPRRHHVILVLCHGEMVFTELAAVLSQRVVLQGQEKTKKTGGVGGYDHIQQMHPSPSLFH